MPTNYLMLFLSSGRANFLSSWVWAGLSESLPRIKRSTSGNVHLWRPGCGGCCSFLLTSLGSLALKKVSSHAVRIRSRLWKVRVARKWEPLPTLCEWTPLKAASPVLTEPFGDAAPANIRSAAAEKSWPRSTRCTAPKSLSNKGVKKLIFLFSAI